MGLHIESCVGRFEVFQAIVRFRICSGELSLALQDIQCRFQPVTFGDFIRDHAIHEHFDGLDGLVHVKEFFTGYSGDKFALDREMKGLTMF